MKVNAFLQRGMFLLCFALSFSPSYLFTQSIRAVMINPPGTDNGSEFFELMGTPGASLDGVWFLSIDGDATESGNIDQAIDMSGYALGLNGIHLRRDGAALTPPPAADTEVSSLDFVPDLENGTNTFLLVSDFTGTVGDDLDTDDDSTLDLTPWSTLLDAIGVYDGGNAYGASLGYSDIPLFSTPPKTAEYIFNESGTWYGGDVSGSNPFYLESVAGGWSIAGTGAPDFDGILITSGGQGPLPVTLMDFRADLGESTVEIKWVTASEQNNAYFLLERSVDRQVFETVVSIEGQGATLATTTYEVSDPIIRPGTIYYRLSQVDHDGQTTVFPLVSVEISQVLDDSWAEVFPNPFVDQIQVASRLERKQPLEFFLFDQKGNQVKSFRWREGEPLLADSLGTLAAGPYFYRLRQGGKQLSGRLIKR